LHYILTPFLCGGKFWRNRESPKFWYVSYIGICRSDAGCEHITLDVMMTSANVLKIPL